jgi:acyl-CoA reductase-like NAD-dependent aldehyde dehydrogenase
VDFIILTGGTETGLRILKERPDAFLAAETGGKNATIVTALSDREQAIGNVITSAFSNSGQKCSATSLLILEREVYDDPKFRRQRRMRPPPSNRLAWDFEPDGLLVSLPQLSVRPDQPGARESWARAADAQRQPQLWTGIMERSRSTTHDGAGPVLASCEPTTGVATGQPDRTASHPLES